MIGSIIDKYEVLQKLGEGATATVYRGRHLTIGKDVAIKVLHPHLSASSRYRERFNREARAVGRLTHQNIVSILDYSGQAGDDCYIVTELVDGVTVLEMLQKHGRLPSEIAALIGADLAAALAFAHKEGIIHRDIKPENVMIRRDGRVKLMDFGVARVLDEASMTTDGSLLGSPAYMSPQQAMDEKLDGRTDLFSLGTVLFHAVTGHVPFSGTNASVILKNIIEANRPEVLELAPDASPGVTAVIDRLLQPRIDDRIATAEIAHDMLVAGLAEMRIPSDHPSVNLRAWVVNPQACGEALQAHLRTTLLDVGKERLAAGDHLGALQLFNRLLAMDDENPEVIALIQSLHQGPDSRRRPRWLAFVLAAGVLLAGIAAAWWTFQRTEAPILVAPTNAGSAALPAQVDPPSPGTTRGPATPAPGSDDAPASAAPEQPKSPVLRLVRPPPAASTDTVQAGEGNGLLVIKVDTWAEAWLDGHPLGRIGRTRMTASTQSPWEATAGRHELLVKNDFSVDYTLPIDIIPGQVNEVTVLLTKLPVAILVNPLMPGDCTLTIGKVSFGALNQHGYTANLTEPSASEEVTLACPGHPPYAQRLGKTTPGSSLTIPKTMPWSP